MTEPVPDEEQGGDPPCWAAQFADDEDAGEDQVPQKGSESPTPDR